MPKLLNTQSKVACPHMAKVDLSMTGNTTLRVGEGAESGFALLVTDKHPVIGCTFMQGSKPSPCVMVEWSAGSTRTKVDGVAVLTEASVGICKSAEQAPQGPIAVQHTPAGFETE